MLLTIGYMLAVVWIAAAGALLLLALVGTRAYDRAEREDREVAQLDACWELEDPEQMPEAEWLS